MLKYHPQNTMRPNFQEKQKTVTFLGQICPKMDFGVGTLKIEAWIRNQRLQYTMCAKF